MHNISISISTTKKKLRMTFFHLYRHPLPWLSLRLLWFTHLNFHLRSTPLSSARPPRILATAATCLCSPPLRPRRPRLPIRRFLASSGHSSVDLRCATMASRRRRGRRGCGSDAEPHLPHASWDAPLTSTAVRKRHQRGEGARRWELGDTAWSARRSDGQWGRATPQQAGQQR